MARNGRYAGTAAVTLPKDLRERLWKQVQEAKAAKPARPVSSAFAEL
ncbi:MULTISPECIES: hypothetical protein [unclassified Mesorhizobium]|nr:MULTISPECIES: hypothetical protein [unclassified Mesorhizobium]MDG4903513.1 hypothetical protein [Mesorhizobium sp. WSM4962]MDG4921437.1 hypothetical protein [Mesorhizobium sp. WSM4989]